MTEASLVPLLRASCWMDMAGTASRRDSTYSATVRSVRVMDRLASRRRMATRLLWDIAIPPSVTPPGGALFPS